MLFRACVYVQCLADRHLPTPKSSADLKDCRLSTSSLKEDRQCQVRQRHSVLPRQHGRVVSSVYYRSSMGLRRSGGRCLVAPMAHLIELLARDWNSLTPLAESVAPNAINSRKQGLAESKTRRSIE